MNGPFSFSPYPMNDVPPSHVRRFRAVHGIGITAIVLIVLVVVFGVILVLAERSEDFGQDPESIADAVRGVAVLTLLAYLIAGIAFWIWQWRASVNAESLAGPSAQFLSREWTFWGWWCPVVSLWFPGKVLADIYRASDPRRRPAVLVGCWWVVTLASMVLFDIVLFSSTTSRIGINDTLLLAAMGCEVVAGALAITIIVTINGWQHRARVMGYQQQPVGPFQWGG
jgi:hypothetical protein